MDQKNTKKQKKIYTKENIPAKRMPNEFENKYL